MELEKIIYNIEQIDEYTKLNIADIKKCIESDDFLIRSDIVQAVTRFIDHDKIYEIIKEATKDRNYIVRCDACEALSFVSTSDSIHILAKRARIDKSATVRSYALTSLVVIMKTVDCPTNILNSLKESYLKEQSISVIISYLTLFYVLKRNMEYIHKALKYIDENDYQIRHGVINNIDAVIDSLSVGAVLAKYKERYMFEPVVSVKNALEIKISEYEEMMDIH